MSVFSAISSQKVLEHEVIGPMLSSEKTSAEQKLATKPYHTRGLHTPNHH